MIFAIFRDGRMIAGSGGGQPAPKKQAGPGGALLFLFLLGCAGYAYPAFGIAVGVLFAVAMIWALCAVAAQRWAPKPDPLDEAMKHYAPKEAQK